MKSRANENVYSFYDKFGMYQFISEGLTESTSLINILDNQFFYSSLNQITFKSDGTKRVGLDYLFKGFINKGDVIHFFSEIKTDSGDLPCLFYEEFNDESSRIIKIQNLSRDHGFEMIDFETLAIDIFGVKRGRFFVGFEKGQKGQFTMRFPVLRHYSQQKYSNSQKIEEPGKTFQVSKSNNEWVIERSTSYRLLDEGTLTFGATTMIINFKVPFKQDIPQVFITENNFFAGHTIKFGYRAKNQIELHLFDVTGKAVKWDTLADGAIFNIKLEAGLYY